MPGALSARPEARCLGGFCAPRTTALTLSLSRFLSLSLSLSLSRAPTLSGLTIIITSLMTMGSILGQFLAPRPCAQALDRASVVLELSGALGPGWNRPQLIDSLSVPDVSTHVFCCCRILADPGIVRDGSGTSFLGLTGRFRAPERGF